MKLVTTTTTGQVQGHSVELIEGCRKGDRASLERVFQAEAPFVERVLYRVVGPSSDLEDLLQVTLEWRATPSGMIAPKPAHYAPNAL